MSMNLFDAHLTLFESAQVFHFRRVSGVYAANVAGRIVTEDGNDDFHKHYFDEARNYEKVLSAFSEFASLNVCIGAFPGLRVVNQPVWEALVAFILSANNNVSRIRNLVNALNCEYGDFVEYKGERLYGFPSPETLSQLEEAKLRETVKCGYRAKYLIGAAKMVKEGFPLEKLGECAYEDARKELMRLPGVGGKVADCVCLFGLGHSEAFPVDVWVKRFMEKRFALTGTPDHIRTEARKLLGSSCGIVQQYLFHAARTGLIEL